MKDYFIRWQFTKENPIPFKTQEEIILSFLIPLVEKKYFLEKANSFYITKINYTTVRLQVFVNHKFLASLQKIVESATTFLVVKNEEEPVRGNIISKGYAPLNREMDFREYLEDITCIGLDLHKNDLVSAKNFAVKSKFESKPIGNLHPKKILNDHFHKFSKHYRLLEKGTVKINNFWNRFCESYSNSTSWDHFYYNIVLGLDLDPMLIKRDASLPLSYKGFVKNAGVPIDNEFLEKLKK